MGFLRTKEDLNAVFGAASLFYPCERFGKELPILEHIDIGGKLAEGNWLGKMSD